MELLIVLPKKCPCQDEELSVHTTCLGGIPGGRAWCEDVGTCDFLEGSLRKLRKVSETEAGYKEGKATSRAKSSLDFIRGGALEQKLYWRIGLAWGKGSAFSTCMGFTHWLQPLGEEDRSTDGQSQGQLCVSDSWGRSGWGYCNTTHPPNDFKSRWWPEVAI